MQMPILFWLDVKCGVMSKVGDGRGGGVVESEVAICMTHHLASYSHGTRTGISVFRKHSF